MKKPTGVNWGKAKAAVVVGHRPDQLPKPIKEPVFKRICEHCGHEALLGREYPNDIPVVCNVCAKDVTAQLTKEHGVPLQTELTVEDKVWLIEEAHRRRIPVEEAYNSFIGWKTGITPQEHPPVQEPQQTKKEKRSKQKWAKKMRKVLNKKVWPKQKAELKPIAWPNSQSKLALVHFEQRADGKFRLAFGGGVDELLNCLVQGMATDQRIADYLTTAVQMYYDIIAEGRDLQKEVNSREITEEEFYSS